MAREFRLYTAGYNDDIETKLAELFEEYPRTAKIDSFASHPGSEKMAFVALVSWDADAEARRPRVMEGR